MLRVPTIQGVIDRRVLVNFRIEPDRIEDMLPGRLRPHLVRGFAVGGICLIRLRKIRPDGWPAISGLRSENVAHRIAVEWDDNGQVRPGVYIPRRDTNSMVNTLLGGRLFPGPHHRATFTLDETDDRFSISMRSRNGGGSITFVGRVAQRWPADSVFDTVDAASAFFRESSVGFSPKPDTADLEAMQLETVDWTVTPLEAEDVESSFFGDRDQFPPGSVAFDNALLMRDIEHRWHERQALCVSDDHRPVA
jgi:Uncharacterized conserved protein (COG2071)